MKIKLNTIYCIAFSFVLLLQLFLPSFKINLAIQLIVLSVFIATGKAKFSVSYLKLIFPLLLLFLYPLIVSLFYGYNISNIIKDISYFLNPIVCISLGYVFYKTINDYQLFLKTVIYSGLLSAVLHIIIVLGFTDFLSGNVSKIRHYTKDNMLEIVALVMLFFSRKSLSVPLFSSRKLKIFLLILFSSILFYFSRTMVVALLIFSLSQKGYTIITRRSLKVIGVLIVSVFLFYTYLFSIKIDRNAKGLEGFLYKVKIAPEEIFITKVNKENHAKLWDHWRGYEAGRALALLNENKTGYLWGMGYGSLVNLKFNAPLGDQKQGMKYISELHNGYVFVLYKTGFIGLFLYLFFLINLYKINFKNRTFVTSFISGIGIFYLFSSIIITGLFNKRDIIVLVLGALLYFKENIEFENN